MKIRIKNIKNVGFFFLITSKYLTPKNYFLTTRNIGNNSKTVLTLIKSFQHQFIKTPFLILGVLCGWKGKLSMNLSERVTQVISDYTSLKKFHLFPFLYLDFKYFVSTLFSIYATVNSCFYDSTLVKCIPKKHV